MTVIPWQERFEGFIAPAALEEYSKRYESFVAMRRENGIIELRLHADGGPFVFTFGAHNALSRLWHDVSNDPANEVVILTGTGDRWFTGDARNLYDAPIYEEDADYVYQQLFDGMKLIETFVNAFEVPTIAVVNGPGIHTDLAMLCDITLSAEDADFFDPHFLVGAVPGDGHLLILQALMGVKRASYYNYTAQPIPAATAVELGLVNEVLPRGELLDRAWELARTIMLRSRFVRRTNHALTVRPWQKLIADEFRSSIAQEIMAHLGSKEPIPMRSMMAGAEERKAW